MPELTDGSTSSLPMLRAGKVQLDDSRLATDGVPKDEPGWVVPLALWIEHRHELVKQRHPVGIEMTCDADVELLADEQGRLSSPDEISFIAIRFDAYTDGRGFSLAQLLRQQLGWTGELRAVGDVIIDTLHYLARCGFDSFALKPGADPEAALNALTTFSGSYQRSYLQPSSLRR